MKISRHNKKTANFPPTDDCIFFFSGRNQNFPPLQKTIQQHNPSDRRLYLFFFSGRNRQNRAPNRQTTVSFIFPAVIDRAPARETTVSFFSGRNNYCTPARQTTVSFFLRWKFGFTNNLSIGDTQEHQLDIYQEKESLCFNILNYMP